MPDFPLSEDFKEYCSRNRLKLLPKEGVYSIHFRKEPSMMVRLSIFTNCLEWGFGIRDETTNANLYSNWYEVLKAGQTRQELIQEKEQSIKEFLGVVMENEIRVVHRPRFTILGHPFGTRNLLEKKVDAVWQDFAFF